MKLLKTLIIAESRMKDMAHALIQTAIDMVPRHGRDLETYKMYVVAKVLELDVNKLFKSDVKAVEEMVKDYFSEEGLDEAVGDEKFDKMMSKIAHDAKDVEPDDHDNPDEIKYPGWHVVQNGNYPVDGPFDTKEEAEKALEAEDAREHEKFEVKYGESWGSGQFFKELPAPSNIKKVFDPAKGAWVHADLNKMTRVVGKEERALWVGKIGAELEEIGIHLDEKPMSWDTLENHFVITPSKMHKLDVKLAEIKHSLKKVSGEDLYDGKKPNAPLANVNQGKLPEDKIFIVQFKTDGSEYLVNTVGADSYIRMWAKIDV